MITLTGILSPSFLILDCLIADLQCQAPIGSDAKEHQKILVVGGGAVRQSKIINRQTSTVLPQMLTGLRIRPNSSSLLERPCQQQL
jgi:hypothetical protein